MSKDKFFEACSVDTEEYSFPNGYKVTLKGLTLKQRKETSDLADDPVKQNAMILISGCDDLDQGDLEKISNMPADKLDEMVDIILRLSGLGDKKKANERSEV